MDRYAGRAPRRPYDFRRAGTLAEQILRPLVGPQNCSFPSASEVVDSDYTGWLAYKRLVVVAEIYDGHTAKAYNRLKAKVTDDVVQVNEKYEKQYDLQNFAHVFASSNSFRALKLDDHDRRWFVPGITEEKQPFEYFRRLRSWLEDDGLSIIMGWAHSYVAEHGPVAAGLHAPASKAKQRSIEEGRSDGERLIADLAETMADAMREGEKLILRIDEIRAWLANKKAALDHQHYGDDGGRMLETEEKIVSIFRACGLRLTGKRFKSGGERFRVIATFDIAVDAKWDELAQYYRAIAAVEMM
jgi:hypothetical protein